jgi:catechol 2,3-dioxygenase-like lactoylglutathione lyase family enzyme
VAVSVTTIGYLIGAWGRGFGRYQGGIVVKITLTSVFVDDPARAFKFYTNVLGFVEQMYIPEANLAIVVSPEEPHGTALLLEPNDNPIASTLRARASGYRLWGGGHL